MPHNAMRVAIIWHMHQPYYRDLVTGECSLPWVRLQTVKNYYPMARLLENFPEIRVTFNLVPCLVKQILEYTEENKRDLFWDKTAIPAVDLTAKDRIFIIQNFFLANWDKTIKPHPRYAELLEKRGYHPSADDLERACCIFSVQDLLDLQVWFNLAWFHPMQIEEDKHLSEMIKAGRNFTEEDKAYILDRQIEIMKKTLPQYRQVQESGQAELSTSPFYHPILPLLVNMESAREALPNLELPSPSFSYPEDASLQLEWAVELHEKIFGEKPSGLWPSEGSVSEEIIPLVMDAGFRWMASDEDVLYLSLGLDPASKGIDDDTRHATLYKPFNLDRGNRSLSIVFRDHFLSDSIGFTYGHWDPKKGADHLVERLNDLSNKLSRWKELPLVSLILDGENPWEYYQDNGYPFLKYLYTGLVKSQRLRTTTVTESLKETPSGQNIPRLFAGSWINHNFAIWIGHQEDRRAWELLTRAREILDRQIVAAGGEYEKKRDTALETILMAEGSDWCWWYGEEHSSGNDESFDEIYRRHLQNVYNLTGEDVPDELRISILSEIREILPPLKCYSFIKPTIDGRVTSYFEWLAAGHLPISRRGSTMHQAESLITAIYTGFDSTTLFLRLDPSVRLMTEDLLYYTFNIHFLAPRKTRIEIGWCEDNQATIIFQEGSKKGREIEDGQINVALMDIFEMSVPFELLGVHKGDRMQFFISLWKGEQEMGHWPHQDYLSLEAPTDDFEDKIWLI